MLEKAREIQQDRVKFADSIEGVLSAVEDKCFVKVPWCGCRECEEKIKTETAASARVIAPDDATGKKCAVCGKEAKHIVYFARAY